MMARPARDGGASAGSDPTEGPLLAGITVTVWPGSSTRGSAAASGAGRGADAGTTARAGAATSSATGDASGGADLVEGASAGGDVRCGRCILIRSGCGRG